MYKIMKLIFNLNLGRHRSAPRSKIGLDVKNEEMFPVLQANSNKKTIAPAAKKVETQTWSKYQ